MLPVSCLISFVAGAVVGVLVSMGGTIISVSSGVLVTIANMIIGIGIDFAISTIQYFIDSAIDLIVSSSVALLECATNTIMNVATGMFTDAISLISSPVGEHKLGFIEDLIKLTQSGADTITLDAFDFDQSGGSLLLANPGGVVGTNPGGDKVPTTTPATSPSAKPAALSAIYTISGVKYVLVKVSTVAKWSRRQQSADRIQNARIARLERRG